MLTTLAKVKTRLGISDATQDALLTQTIEAVSARFDGETGRTLQYILGAQEIARGDEVLIPLRAYPLDTITQFEVHTWGRESGGAGSGLFVTKDGGTTWKRATGNGLPEKPVGKVSLAIPRVNGRRPERFEDVGVLTLAVEVLSPNTSRAASQARGTSRPVLESGSVKAKVWPLRSSSR